MCIFFIDGAFMEGPLVIPVKMLNIDSLRSNTFASRDLLFGNTCAYLQSGTVFDSLKTISRRLGNL